MSRSRSSLGAWIAVAGAIALLVAVFALPWYTATAFEAETFGPGEQPAGTPGQPSLIGQNQSGETVVLTFGDEDAGAWKGQELLGTLANLVMIAAAVLALALALAAATAERVPRWLSPVAAGLAILAVAMVALRIVFPPTSDADLKAGLFVALGGALVIVAGRLLALREREGPPPEQPA